MCRLNLFLLWRMMVRDAPSYLLLFLIGSSFLVNVTAHHVPVNKLDKIGYGHVPEGVPGGGNIGNGGSYNPIEHVTDMTKVKEEAHKHYLEILTKFKTDLMEKIENRWRKHHQGDKNGEGRHDVNHAPDKDYQKHETTVHHYHHYQPDGNINTGNNNNGCSEQVGGHGHQGKGDLTPYPYPQSGPRENDRSNWKHICIHFDDRKHNCQFGDSRPTWNVQHPVNSDGGSPQFQQNVPTRIADLTKNQPSVFQHQQEKIDFHGSNAYAPVCPISRVCHFHDHIVRNDEARPNKQQQVRVEPSNPGSNTYTPSPRSAVDIPARQQPPTTNCNVFQQTSCFRQPPIPSQGQEWIPPQEPQQNCFPPHPC